MPPYAGPRAVNSATATAKVAIRTSSLMPPSPTRASLSARFSETITPSTSLARRSFQTSAPDTSQITRSPGPGTITRLTKGRPQIATRGDLPHNTVGHVGRRGSVRWSSESATGSKIWTFEEIQALSKSRSPTSSPKVTLIDVREPSELASTGRIPGSVNVPITTSPDSFHISPEEFEDRYGFERPDPEKDEIVFYCKAGVRSRAAAGIAREAGWEQVGEYPGSWVEWSGKGGKIER